MHHQFNYVTDNAYQRTHQSSDEVWLQVGWHEVKVEYYAQIATSSQQPNGQGYKYSALKI